MMRFSRSLLAATALAAALVSIAPATGAELVIGRPASPATFDPGFLKEAATLVDNVFDTLVLRDAEMKLVPGLALSWKALDDTTWEIKLRPGIKFHNGEAFDAEAVKFTFERVLDPAAKSPTISYIRTVAGVDVVDPLTVRIRTNGPDPLLPTRLSRYPAYIVPPAYVKQVGAAEFARRPVGTGPYKVTEFVPDDHVTMVANEAYWRGKATIDKVVWRPIPEATARIAALLSGEVQFIESVPAELVDTLKTSGAADVVDVKNGGLTIYLGLKSAEKPLDDARVRRALSLAIDRKGLTTDILKGKATPTGTQVSPFDAGYKDIPTPAYDPAAAKKLLAEAGYPNGFTIRFQAPRRYISSAEVAQAVVQQWAAIGVKAELEVPEWSVYAQQVPAGKQAPIYMLAWGSTQTLDADAALYAILKSGEPYSTVADKALDALLDESRKTIAPDARAAIFAKIQDHAAETVPLITLYREDSLYGKAKSVTFGGRPDARIPVYDIRVVK
ncbi:ABC transporter substrate-binding protein [Prosthecomicrobium hirschii]|nr:ABC transporter substrate-binding protein [Prosthecomicrobium hirschii]